MSSNDRRPAVFAVAQNQSSIESDEPQQRLMTPHFGILCLSALFSALGFSSVIPTVARFVVTDLNGGDVEVGLALGVFSFSAVLARPWIGRLGDRRGRRLLIAGGSFITAGVLAAHAFADSYSTLLIARLLMGAVQGAFFVGTVTLTTDLAPEHRRGEAASYFSVAIYGGMAFGPWLGEWAVGRWGFDGGFMVGGLCMGLAATAVINYAVDTRESKGVSICPGPNMAYFSKELSLSQMTHHIYNGVQEVVRSDRPNMFVNELGMYLKYLADKIDGHKNNWDKASAKKLNAFVNNMNEGIDYYRQMFNSIGDTFIDVKESVINSLNDAVQRMEEMGEEISILAKENQQ